VDSSQVGDLGGTEPGQYILPHRADHPKGEPRKNLPPNFRKPMGKINRAAQEIFAMRPA
jgi:hypothetical protein